MIASIFNVRAWMSDKRTLVQGAIALLTVSALVLTALLLLGGTRRPPSIFDSPVDDVLSFLSVEEFSRLPLTERLEFLVDVLERFGSMDQSDSAVAAAFLAGLAGPAREQLRDNARVLVRDILIEGADEYFAQPDDEAKAKFLDDWLIKWARLAANATGDGRDRSDEQLLAGMRRDAQRDNDRAVRNPIASTEANAWLFMDYWDSEVASVSSPGEQSKIFHFVPALREHLLRGG